MANIKHTNKYSLSRLLNKKEKHNSENEKELKTSNKEAMKKISFKKYNIYCWYHGGADIPQRSFQDQSTYRLWINYSKYIF